MAVARRQSAADRKLDARLALAAALAALGRSVGTLAVVVGGTAVDFYAAQATPLGLEPSPRLRASDDVDIIAVGSFGDAKLLRLALAASADFYPRIAPDKLPVEDQRTWWVKGAPLAVDIIRGELYGDPERITRVAVAGGEAYIWGAEDTAWQYMQASLALRDRTCWERARAIAAAQEPLDWDYLRTRADALAPVGLVAALLEEDSYDEMLERMG